MTFLCIQNVPFQGFSLDEDDEICFRISKLKVMIIAEIIFLKVIQLDPDPVMVAMGL